MPCGLWVSTDTDDYIYARQGTSSLHHKHFVLHEVGHMICGHQGLDPALGLASMLPHLKPEMIRRALGRTTYSDPQEQEAEAFADLLYHYARRNWSKQESDELAERAAGLLGIRD
jgi:alcohol dehydrogenase YqhD (iron-dependent ADH family)